MDLVRDGVVLAYDDAGAGYPAVVFVHGAACNRRFWHQQVPRFSSAHRVVAVDLRGHGESDAPSERYTVRLFAEDLASTCTRLGIESPVVIGHSLGGLVALDFASAYPDQVAAAVLIDSPLLPGGNRAEVVRDLVAGLRGRDPDSALRGYFARLFFGPYALTGLKAGQSEVLYETVTVRADALGTQVGSEGVKAPANADEQMKDNVKAVVVLIGANDCFTEGNGQPIPDGDAQDTQASLGRENSIECLVRAEVSDEGRAQSRKPAPVGITFCHEGLEIQ